MEEIYYSIVMKKTVVSEKNGNYFLRADKIVRGKYDSDEGCFITDDGKVLYGINGITPSSFNQSDEFVDFLIGENDLLEELSLDIDEALAKFYEQCKNIMIIVKCDNDNDIVKTKEIDLSNPNLEDCKTYYEQMKESFNKEDITIIASKELEKLLNENDPQAFINNIFKIRDDKLSYYDKYNNDKCLYSIDDENFSKIIGTNDIGLIKDYLIKIKNISNNMMIINTIDIVNLLRDCQKEINNSSKDTCSFLIAVNKHKNIFIEAIEQLEQISEYDVMESILFCNRIVDILNKTYDMVIDNDGKLNNIIKSFNFRIEQVKKSFTNILLDEYDQEDVKLQELDFKNLYDEISSEIINRDEQIAEILSIIIRNDKVVKANKRKFAMIIGSTGTGKTRVFSVLKKSLQKVGRPVCIVDTNQITTQGYVGGSIEENILLPLLLDAEYMVDNNMPNSSVLEIAEHGIVFLDEIDKRIERNGENDNINKSGVINQILKLMDEGNVYNVKMGDTIIPFNTSNLTIFASGTCQEYFNKIKKDKDKYNLGFNSNKQVEKKEIEDENNRVCSDDLLAYGMDPQLVGRFPHLILFPSYSVETLARLEKNPNTSNLYNEREHYKKYGIELYWEEGFEDEIARIAFKENTGGRAVNNIVSRTFSGLDNQVYRKEKGFFTHICLPKSAINNPGEIMLKDKNNRVYLLKELIEKTKNESMKKEKNKQFCFNKKEKEKILSLLNRRKSDINDTKAKGNL